MTRLVLQPYRVMGLDSVIWGEWQFFYEGSEERFYSPPPWDSATSLWISCRVKVHLPRLLLQTGVRDAKQLLLVAQVDSSTYFRGIASTQLSNTPQETAEKDFEVAVHLPPGSCASKISASAHILLGEIDQAMDDPTVANRIGARLASSGRKEFNLDPLAPLFPTEAMAFDGMLPIGAPWLLNVAYEDLNDAFYGAVRLFINTSHPGGRAALSSNSGSTLLTASLKVDIVRSLFLQVAAHEGSVPANRDYEPDSVGQVLQSMSSSYFNSDFDKVVKMLRSDPIEFDARLQSSLEYMKVV